MSSIENIDLGFFAEIAQLKNRLWKKKHVRYEYGIASGGAWALALTRTFGGSSQSCDGCQDFSSIKRQLNIVGIDANSSEAQHIVHCSPEWAFKLAQNQLNNYALIAQSEGAASCIVFLITSHIGVAENAPTPNRCCIIAMQKNLLDNSMPVESLCEYYKCSREYDSHTTRIQHELITTLLLQHLELRTLFKNYADAPEKTIISNCIDRLTSKIKNFKPYYHLTNSFKNFAEVIEYRKNFYT